MKYEKIVKGIFLSRPNRFIADVFVDGIEAKAHVKNTGRCEELLITGATVYLEDHFGRMGSRKLRYSLIGIEKDTESGPIMVNMDSQAPNKVIKEALESGKLSRYITEFPTADLIGVDGAICLPHLGASTPEAEDNCAVMAANQLKDYIENGNITNSVNYPAVSAAREGTARICICHMNRANMIAQFAAAISAKGINIANMTDKAKGDYAYGIIDIENEADDGLVRELEEIEGVIRVRVV